MSTMFRCTSMLQLFIIFFFQAEDGIRDVAVTGVQTCALPIFGISPKTMQKMIGVCLMKLSCDSAMNLRDADPAAIITSGDRKSTRLNSSHGYISYAVFCLKKKKSRGCRMKRCAEPLNWSCIRH